MQVSTIFNYATLNAIHFIFVVFLKTVIKFSTKKNYYTILSIHKTTLNDASSFAVERKLKDLLKEMLTA